MKILRIIDRLNTGGPAIHAILLSRYFSRYSRQGRWETILVVGTPGESEGDMMDLARQNDVETVVIPSLGRELGAIRDLRTFWELYRLIARERPDIVHTHKSKAGVLGRLAARLCGTKVIIHTFHGHVLSGYFGRARSRLFQWIERAMARLSDRIIAVSPRVKADLVRFGVAPPEKIEVIYLGLDLSRFAAKPRGQGTLRAELGLSKNAPVVGIVARLVPIKGVGLFLEAARAALKSRPDARFVIVGDGEMRAELEARARQLGVTARVRFLGFRDDLENIYSDLDVLMLTSSNEGSPVSLIEGLSCGCAVVSTGVGGVADVVRDGETGILVPPGDPQALAQAVCSLLADPERRRRLGEAGRRDALGRFTVERLGRDLESLYLKLI